MYKASKKHNRRVKLNQAEAHFQDNLFYLIGPYNSHNFVQVDYSSDEKTKRKLTFSLEFILARDKYIYNRRVQTIFDLIGEIGGFVYGIIFICGLLLRPYNY